MGWRYRVLNLPPIGARAFTPLPTTNPVASSFGLVRRTALLGRVPIDTPPTTKAILPPLTTAEPKCQPTYCSPDYILPDCYITYPDGLDQGHRLNFNNVPVPAKSWIAIPGVATSHARIRTGSRRAMPWPRAFQRYPTESKS